MRERRESRRTEVQMKEQVKGKEKLKKSTKNNSNHIIDIKSEEQKSKVQTKEASAGVLELPSKQNNLR